MNDETKKDDYYREQWAKIQVEKHNAWKNTSGWWWWLIAIPLILYNCSG